MRNGEDEDTMWATLEVLGAVTTRLKGDELRDFTLTVTRECVGDLSSQMYCTAAGRLLTSVMSANVCAFVLIISPALTHIKENLRHPKSPTHSQYLLTILRIFIEGRIILAETRIADQDRGDFAATDPAFQTLYADIYRGLLRTASRPDACHDDVNLATEAVQGAAALVCQPAVRRLKAESLQSPSGVELLLPEGVRAEVCEVLFSIAARAWHGQARKDGSDELVNETIKALRRAVEAHPSGFHPLLERGVAVIRESYAYSISESVDTIQRVSSVLAFVGSSCLRPSLANAMRSFLGLSCALTSELLAAMDKKLDPNVWCALATGVLSTVHYFRDACQDAGLQDSARDQLIEHDQSEWLPSILDRYPILDLTGTPDHQSLVVPEFSSVSEFRGDFLLVGLFICRQLYRRATKPVEDEPRHGMRSLGLSNDYTGASQEAEYRYLCLVSDLASLVMGEMNRSGTSLQFEVFFLSLFRDEFIPIPSATTAEVSQNAQHQGSWSWLALGPVNVLSFGILKSLPPSGVLRLVSTSLDHLLRGYC